jgi:ferredoxin
LILMGVFVFRKNLEVWCPFGGVECLSLYLHDGKMLCALGASNFFILAAILLLTLAFKRVFCGYMCPVGALAEAMRCLAKRCGIKPLSPAPAVDRVLSLLKYVILAGVLWGTFAATDLIARRGDPCFAMIGSGTNEAVPWTAFVVLGLLAVSSLFVSMPFCRWFCPFAAVLNVVSRLGLTRIHRDTATCIDCGRCSRACPMRIDVAKSPSVTDARDVERPAIVAEHCLKIEGVTCSGSARQLLFFLDRDDQFAVPGYLKVLTSPGPGLVEVRLQYDPGQTGPNALIEPYYDAAEARWRSSPFRVEGYDPLADF